MNKDTLLYTFDHNSRNAICKLVANNHQFHFKQFCTVFKHHKTIDAGAEEPDVQGVQLYTLRTLLDERSILSEQGSIFLELG